ncbi:MAG: 2-hydroxyglutaryl-CoA dehydratase [Calditrichaeota bacterium]|nr:MAG: 2-hydroxyglutaryl-CoA dehydratase [Calditrichota bacterium]
MTYTLGLDVGSTYTKAVVLNEKHEMVSRAMEATGSKLTQVAQKVAQQAAQQAGLALEDIAYIITTGYGRHLVPFRDLQVTDLTATARGAHFLFPATRTVLDIGGQTMKASRVDEASKVVTFRLNDKCAAGTGAFLEKTARYMGYSTEDIGKLLELSKERVPISGVCAVFAESEVISHLSEGVPPEDIMNGAIMSLTDRSVQLMKRIRSEPEYTLVGGILRWRKMAEVIREKLAATVNVPDGDMPQFTAALGCAILGHLRLKKLQAGGHGKSNSRHQFTETRSVETS